MNPGTATITYTNNNGCTNSVTITVTAPDYQRYAQCHQNATTNLAGSGTPTRLTPWTSSNTAVATVNNAGVTGVNAPRNKLRSPIPTTRAAQHSHHRLQHCRPSPAPAAVCAGGTIALTGSGTPAQRHRGHRRHGPQCRQCSHRCGCRNGNHHLPNSAGCSNTLSITVTPKPTSPVRRPFVMQRLHSLVRVHRQPSIPGLRPIQRLPRSAMQVL